MKQYRAVFGSRWTRYRVELEVREEGEPTSDCFVYHAPYGDASARQTGCQASLAALQDTGYLENMATGSMHKVEPAVIDEIAEWAQENGY